jgi:hypothetical protein
LLPDVMNKMSSTTRTYTDRFVHLYDYFLSSLTLSLVWRVLKTCFFFSFNVQLAIWTTEDAQLVLDNVSLEYMFPFNTTTTLYVGYMKGNFVFRSQAYC